ncbi:MAG: D-alanine--D-alanine ligase [Planctomycetes bacterium]|nr:D-alanine--D-alanine ligase [Planctomycetota bacterium]
MHVLILHDEIPECARTDVADALVQAEFIESVLTAMGHSSDRLSFNADLPAMRHAISSGRPDVVFNLVESVGGEGRLIYLAPALLDSMGIPYAGARTEAMFLTSGKALTKKWLAANFIPTPAWRDGHGGSRDLPFPARYIIKSVWEEASIGLDDSSIVLAKSAKELAHEIDLRRAGLGGEAFAEQFIDGREFNLSLLSSSIRVGEMDVLPPAEIEFIDFGPEKPRIVGYAAKWDESSFEYSHTPRRFEFPSQDGMLLEKLRQYALRCAALVDLRGYARVDFRVDAQGNPWVLEVNANPCLSPDAGFMAAATRAGLSPEQVIERILADTSA